MTKQQRNAGMVFMALGIYVIYYTLTKLKVGTIRSPGSGFFTLLCGVAILLFATILVITGFVKGTRNQPLWEKGGWIKPLLALLIAVGYSLLITPLGFILATFVFVMAWQFIVEREKPVKALIVSAVGSVGMWAIFELLLRVPLPNGLLPW